MAKKDGGLRFQPSGGSRAPQVPVGKKQKLAIERLANDGRGIAFNEGRTWFVSGALAGEQIEARVLGAQGKVVEARVERIFTANAERRSEACVHAKVCGGCSLQHMPHAEQLALKQRMLAEQLSRLANLQPQEWAAPLVGPELGYRRRARIATPACMAAGGSPIRPDDPRLGTRRRGQPPRQAARHRDDGAVRAGDVPDRAEMVDGGDRHGLHGDRGDVAVAAARAATVSKAAGTLPA